MLSPNCVLVTWWKYCIILLNSYQQQKNNGDLVNNLIIILKLVFQTTLFFLSLLGSLSLSHFFQVFSNIAVSWAYWVSFHLFMTPIPAFSSTVQACTGCWTIVILLDLIILLASCGPKAHIRTKRDELFSVPLLQCLPMRS